MPLFPPPQTQIMGTAEGKTVGEASINSLSPPDGCPPAPWHGDTGSGQSAVREDDSEKRQHFPGKSASEKELLSIAGEERKKHEEKLSNRVTSTIPLQCQSPLQKRGRSTET